MDDQDNELILSKEDQIPSDFFRKGDTVRAVIKDVKVRIKPLNYDFKSLSRIFYQII